MGRPSTAESLKEYFSSGVNKKRWEEAKVKAASRGSFGEYDDGKYRVKIVKAAVNRSETSGRLQHVLAFKFLEGDYKGQSVYQYQGVDNDTGLEILIGTLKKLGYDVESPEEIEEIVDKKLIKQQPEVMIRLKTNGEYQNLVVLKALEEKAEEEESEDDDDDDSEADDAEESVKASEDDDDDDDEDGEEETKEKDSEDDEDAEEETDEDDDDDDEDEDTKPVKKKSVKPAKAEVVEEEEDAEKVELKVGMRLKVQHNKEVKKGKIVKLDDDAGRVKVKFADGEKAWVTADEIVDIVE